MRWARSGSGSRWGWGTTYNRAMKTLMLDHAFQSVEAVLFHVGASNVRSQKAMERLGGVRVGLIETQYVGERVNPNVVYRIHRDAWRSRSGPG